MNTQSFKNSQHRDLLTVVEFCEALRIKQATGRKWILLRRVAIFKVGSRLVRIPRSELDRILAQGFRPARDDK